MISARSLLAHGLELVAKEGFVVSRDIVLLQHTFSAGTLSDRSDVRGVSVAKSFSLFEDLYVCLVSLSLRFLWFQYRQVLLQKTT